MLSRALCAVLSGGKGDKTLFVLLIVSLMKKKVVYKPIVFTYGVLCGCSE